LSANPLFAQKSSNKEDGQAYSDSRTATGTSIFDAKVSKTATKNSRLKRSKKSSTLKKQPYKRSKIKSSRKKGRSDCDCPGSNKAKRKKKRA
jgi:hypothetical protein